MKRVWIEGFVSIAALVMLSGCMLLSPYKESFPCPDFDRGKCTGVVEAYHESMQGKTAKCSACKAEAKAKGLPISLYCTACENRAAKNDAIRLALVHPEEQDSAESLYRRELYGKLAGLLRAPQTPVLSSPKVMRVLILPYVERDRELFTTRHVFFVVDEARWVLGGDSVETGYNNQ